MSTLPLSDITGIVLAGGRARRMGGREKGLALLAGQPLVTHVLEALRPQVGRVLINANRHHDDYMRLGARFEAPVIGDAIDEYAGPLAGMASSLRHLETKWGVTVPCDAPRLAPDLVVRLTAGSDGGQHPLCVARTADGLQPVWCLLHRDRADSLDAFLAAGGRKVVDWLKNEGAVIVDFDDTEAFVNLNTEEELQRMDRVLDGDPGHEPDDAANRHAPECRSGIG